MVQYCKLQMQQDLNREIRRCHESDCEGSRRLSHVLVTRASVSQFVKISCPEPLVLSRIAASRVSVVFVTCR
jgi:hypothetical protein